MEEERVVDPSLLMRPPAPVPAPPPPPAVPVPPPPGPRASPLDIRWCRERTREETGGAAGGGGGGGSSTEPQADRLSLSAMVSSGLVVAGAVTDPLRDMVVALPPWGRESTQSVQHKSKVPFVCCVLSGLSAGAAKRAGILFFFKLRNYWPAPTLLVETPGKKSRAQLQALDTWCSAALQRRCVWISGAR